MLARLFTPTPVVDDSVHLWILDTFAWAIENFDIDVFKNETQLVLPNNDFYPGNVNSVEEMADSIFQRTKNYASMQKWPIKLFAPTIENAATIEQLRLTDVIRGENAMVSVIDDREDIVLGFNPAQVNQPQDLIAGISQALASILVIANKTLPPGGKEYLPQAIDLVSCFMGFGVIFANTAYQFKGGCGGCNNTSINRQSALTEPETLYALALFCLLKKEPINRVKKHLKSHLQRDFIKAHKALQRTIGESAQPALLAMAS
jgi:hypothetical protein